MRNSNIKENFDSSPLGFAHHGGVNSNISDLLWENEVDLKGNYI